MNVPTTLLVLWLMLASLASSPARADGAEVAMVTELQGKVSRGTPQGPQPVLAFSKLRHGDLMILPRGSRLQLVYFESARQETWKGSGRLEIARKDSIPYGLAPPEVRALPAVMVRQIAKTPALDTQGRAGMMRLRAIGAVGEVATVDATYERLRLEADAQDIGPELYLLSALFELREFERVEKTLEALQIRRSDHPSVPSVVALYSQALAGARQAPRTE